MDRAILPSFDLYDLGSPVLWGSSNKPMYILQGSNGNIRLKIDSDGVIQIPGVLTSQNLKLTDRV